MPLKIAFFLPHLDAGGVEKVVLNLLTHLDRKQFSPLLILSNKRGALLPLVPQDVTIHSFDGIAMRRTIKKLRQLIKDEQIDALYGGTNAANITASLACIMLPHKPLLIISEHTPPSLFLDNAKWKPLRILAMKTLYPLADGIAVPTKNVAEELKATLSTHKLKTQVLPNPLIDTHLMAKEILNNPLPLTPLKLISAGRLVKLEGFDILIDAMKILIEQGVSSELTILGEGPEREALEHQISTLELTSHIKLTGAVSNPMDYFSNSSIFVMASRREGFGNVLIEAMACGIPVISSDCPVGPRIILQDGKSGILIPINNHLALVDAIHTLLSDPTQVCNFRKEGLRRSKDFAIDSATQKFQTYIQQLRNQR